MCVCINCSQLSSPLTLHGISWVSFLPLADTKDHFFLALGWTKGCHGPCVSRRFFDACATKRDATSSSNSETCAPSANFNLSACIVHRHEELSFISLVVNCIDSARWIKWDIPLNTASVMETFNRITIETTSFYA